MRLRPRQKTFVERSLAALCDHGNTLSIASTGFGKTIALSAVVAKSLEGSDAKACILAHRDELTAQNRTKFGRVAPEITTSVFDAETKSWAGRAIFAMVPTLTRPANLAAMPALDLLVIDEVGYLSYGNRHADLLFEVVTRRHLLRPVVLTTNKPFAEWAEVFPNATCVVTLVDRLVHRAEIVAVEAESYRLKEAKERSTRKAKERAARKRSG